MTLFFLWYPVFSSVDSYDSSAWYQSYEDGVCTGSNLFTCLVLHTGPSTGNGECLLNTGNRLIINRKVVGEKSSGIITRSFELRENVVAKFSLFTSFPLNPPMCSLEVI